MMVIGFRNTLCIFSCIVCMMSQAYAESSSNVIPHKPFNLGGLVLKLENDLAQKSSTGEDSATLEAAAGDTDGSPELTETEINNALNGKSAVAAKMAANFPSATRQDMEKLFNLALFVHRKSEKLLGLPENDIYGAGAAFVYGNWSVYNDGMTVPDEHLSTMVSEIRTLLNEQAPEFQKQYQQASKADQLAAYEEMAIIGNWMLIMQQALKQESNLQALANLKGNYSPLPRKNKQKTLDRIFRRKNLFSYLIVKSMSDES